ncbi:DUF5017 domain-containing protein [Mariniflexile ostreae]|uniref:DUF5017 domain-containing protein n=1 Tax=Mariniflexile ostreae TaxID=1520892 RepID=A0ABV5FFP4_9FLAO
MKKTVYVLSILLLVTFVFQSCDDLEEVDTPNFDIAFNETVKVGEPIEFTVNNAPNFLSFFTGELGREYKNRNRTKAEGSFTLSFETSRHYMDGASLTDNAWSLLYSTDYSGSGLVEDVQTATWTDISDRFTFATDRTYNKTNSGIVDITDLSTDKPVYFALRVYAEGKKEDGNRQGIFDFYSFDLKVELDEVQTLEIANIQNPGWVSVNIEGTNSNDSYDHWVNKSGGFRLHGGLAEYTNDDWLISLPLTLSGAVDPDRGLPLKTYSERLEAFEYTYTEPGTYKITFVGSNETIYGQEDNIKEYTITVTE